MPDILLIQPPIRDFYLTVKRTIPYGLACIASALTKSGFTVDIFDGLATSKSQVCDLPLELGYLREYYGRADQSPFALFHRYRHFGYSFDYIGRRARESGAFLVGISSLFTPYVQEAIQTAASVKTHHPNCKVVLGGHHPSALPHSVMETKAVDFVIRGEGEVAMPRLAEALSKGNGYDAIPGLVFRRQDSTLHINPPVQMKSPDAYPLPAIHLLNHRFYRRHKRAGMVIVASRGCPMKCTYCSVGSQSFMNYRQRSVESVIEEIELSAARYDLGFIDFEDENLSLDRRWFLRLLHEIKSRFGDGRLELRAMNGLYPPTLDNEVVGAMQAAGFRALNLSLGSTSKEQLKRFNRADVLPAFDWALELAEDYGLNAVGYLICAAPYQRAEDSLSDLLYLAQRRVVVGVSIYYPAPGSKDFDLCEDLTILPDHFTCMRSSALPLSHTTSRKEAATLLRLARILNFIKSLLDTGRSIPNASREKITINDPGNRMEIGRQLVARFLDDGKIRGVSP
ncbi:MAG: B12-binding domain-containing radical SAM protein, partial [Desulfobacterales bacterium]|nr:B12-binding domain-containing radical SAM protein [Desulfobacterales bacterium]